MGGCLVNPLLNQVYTRLRSRARDFVDSPDANRGARLLFRFNTYRRLSWQMWRRGVPAHEIVRTQFPLLYADSSAPVYITVEFTNYCNLRCVYCINQLGLRPRGFMQREVFDNFLEDVRQLGVRWVRVLGNGEATLHPEFSFFIRQIARTVPYVSLLTNGQWKDPRKIVDAMLEVNVKGSRDPFETSSDDRPRSGRK
jgi:hypothetical protein